MKKLFSRGKVLITYVSVLAILAVSILSVFTGVTLSVAAEEEAAPEETAPVVVYPLNDTYDASFDDYYLKNSGIEYVDVDTNVKTEVSNFTEFDSKFWLTTEGDGTAANPYIVKTANQFAAVATGNLLYEDGTTVLDTTGLTFKVADNVKAFNMNNTTVPVDCSGDMTADAVEAAFKDAEVIKELKWNVKATFKGRFDGNGVVVYGLKANGGSGAKFENSRAAIFPETDGDVTIRNLTVKNCYFYGDASAVFVGISAKKDCKTIFENCSAYSNVVISNRKNDAIVCGGIFNTYNSGDYTALVIDNCLAYGNIAKHETYPLTYGMWGRAQSPDSAKITNSILMDLVPHTQYHGSNAFLKSTYTSVYTNALNKAYENIDYNSGNVRTYTYNYAVAGEIVNAEFVYYEGDKNAEKSYKYTRKFEAGSFINITDTSLAQGAAAQTNLTKLDWSKWTVNASGYPTPKIYKVVEYSAGRPWSGNVALFFPAGAGTTNAPYQVTNAEELALMLLTAKPGEQFELTTDIVINDTSVANWTDTAKQWFTSNDVPTFAGILNGNGHSVKGLYYSGNQAGAYAGLIPVVGSGTEIRELTVEDAVLNGNTESVMGGAVGMVEDNAAKVVKFNAVTIKDTVKFNGGAVTGGIIGKIGYSAVHVNDCISLSGGLFSSVAGQATVKRSISVGAYPFADANYIKAENVYTDTAGLEVEGVSVIANADMIGEVAEEKMAALNFPISWITNEGTYPSPTGAVLAANGIEGEVWSGAIASEYAGGSGTEEDPWLIKTAEQLALCIYDPRPVIDGVNYTNTDKTKMFYYKLGADIYLNDVNANLWASKIGCNEWFNQRTTKSYGAFNYVSFDGDGFIVHGIYINNTQGNEYIRAGLFPQIGAGVKIKNLGVSGAYIVGHTDGSMADDLGAVVGSLSDWSEFECDPHDNPTNRLTINTPEFQAQMPTISNCFVDHTCYISGNSTGGFVGAAGGPHKLENCIFTGSLSGRINDDAMNYTGALIGTSYSYGDTIIDCLSLPQTCDRPAAGSSNSAWRISEIKCVTEAIDTYYFSKSFESNSGMTKLAKPEMRQGDLAKESMPGLDWEQTRGDGGTWRVVDGGTPVLTVFAKNRTAEELEKYSDTEFAAPTVTITLVTGVPEITLDPLRGSMYSKVTFPTLSREGYEFTGWYAFSDFSLKYEYETFIARDVAVYAGWEPLGIIQDYEQYTDTIWDYDDEYWRLNKPGAKGGYKSAYVRNGSKSMHLLGDSSDTADSLLNYEDMLEVGKTYTISFWVTTDKENNPATVLSLVHNSIPEYKDSAVATESMLVTKGLKVGEWVQYTYTFTAQTKWISLRATGNSSLYFDDIFILPTDAKSNSDNLVYIGTSGNVTTGGTSTTEGGAVAPTQGNALSSVISGGNNGTSNSPQTGDVVSVAALVSAIMSCAIVAVITRKNLVEAIED